VTATDHAREMIDSRPAMSAGRFLCTGEFHCHVETANHPARGQ
jgi:hypothetical protein